MNIVIFLYVGQVNHLSGKALQAATNKLASVYAYPAYHSCRRLVHSMLLIRYMDGVIALKRAVELLNPLAPLKRRVDLRSKIAKLARNADDPEEALNQETSIVRMCDLECKLRRITYSFTR